MEKEALISKLIDNIKEEKRPHSAVITEYGKYTNRQRVVFYNDHNECYDEPYTAETVKKTEVRSAKAFVEYIKDELARRNNDDGHHASVQLGLEGGKFTADDDFNEGICTYSRLKSEQLIALENAKGRTFTQTEFLQLLQRLKPSIPDFKNIWTTFSKLRIERNSRMSSNPVFDDNLEMEEGCTCTYEIQSGANVGTTEEVRIPLEFQVIMPFVKAGEKLYDFKVELVVSKGNYGIEITTVIPDYEIRIEQAIIDEAEFIKNSLKDAIELLVLADL